MKSSLEDQPIEILGLSIPAHRCLEQAGLRTVGEVVSSSDGELLRMLDHSARILAEVQKKASLHLFNSLRLLDLSQQSYKALTQYGIQSVTQLMVMSDEKIRDIPNINAGLLFEVTTRLRAYLDSSQSPWTSLRVLDLPTHVYYALTMAGTRTIEHLQRVSESQLENSPNIDQQSIAEIKGKLAEYSAAHPEVGNSVVAEGENEHSSSPSLTSVASDPRKLSPSRPLGKPIETLNLSVRAYNCLKRGGLETVGQVASLSDEELLSIRNLGMVTLTEIRGKLAECELKQPDFTTSSPETQLPLPLTREPAPERANSVSSVRADPESTRYPQSASSPLALLRELDLPESSRNALARHGIESIDQLLTMSNRQIWETVGIGSDLRTSIWSTLRDYLESPTSPWTHLKVLDLSVRPHNALMKAGIRTVEHLAAASTQDIRDVPNIGEKSMVEIQEKLATYLARNPDFSRPVLSPADPVSPSSSGQGEAAATSESTPRSPMNASFELLSLSPTCSDALRMAGCETIDDVAALLAAGLPWNPRCLDQESRSEITERLDTFFARYPSLSRPTPLEVLNLSVRCYNALMRCGICTVEKLARLSDQEIWDIRNIGSKSVAEIEDKLETYLKIHPPPVQPVSLPSKPEPLPPPPPPPSLIDQEMISSIEDKDIPLDTISVERLALSEWDLILLGKAGVKTLGDLARQPRDTWKREGQITQHLEKYLRWVVEQDETVWANEVADRGISPLHRLKLAETSLSDLTEEWLGPLTSRQKKIIRLRYGLQGEELTLRAIGKRLDLSGARIQQLQSKILRILQMPQCCTTIRPLNALLVHLLEQAGGLLNAAQLDAALRAELVIGEVDPVGVARLALEVLDGVEWLRKAEVWGLTSAPLSRVPDIQKRLVSVLEKAYAPLPCDTVIARLKATRYYRTHRDELEDRFVVACLKTHLEIEIDESGLCGLTKWEKRKLDEVVLALRQIGKPVHYSVIAERANALLPSDQQTSERNIWAILDRYSTIFVCLGRGRYWLRDHLITRKAGKEEVDFGDLFGDRLTRWQEELDRRKAESEFDAHAEVDKIRQVGLEFFDE